MRAATAAMVNFILTTLDALALIGSSFVAWMQTETTPHPSTYTPSTPAFSQTAFTSTGLRKSNPPRQCLGRQQQVE